MKAKHQCLVMLAGVALYALMSLAQPSLPSFPRLTPPVNTNGTVLLAWNYGVPYLNTLSNLTTRTVINSGVFNYYMVSGLPIGSTNVFVAFNEAGPSNLATGIAQAYIPKCEIRVYSYLVTVPTLTNGVTTILTSTNMSIWSKIRSVTNLGPTYQFVWTNDLVGQRFFRSVLP